MGDVEFGAEHLAWLRVCRELSLVMRDVEMTKLLAKEATRLFVKMSRVFRVMMLSTLW